MRQPLRIVAGLVAVAAGLALLALGARIGFALLDRAYPPDLSRLQALSTQVVDAKGRPLRDYLGADGIYRLRTEPAQVDPRYLALLIAFEDKRFHRHPGVDPLAMARAVGQALRHGRIVSGASTLTMQAVRLLEPRPRTLGAKLVEMFRALQLERRFSKEEILGIYLTLAPFGGNVEGVNAAARSWFGHSAAVLSPGEAALLVALPRAPSRLRPDRYPAEARQARDLVLQRTGAGAGYAAGMLRLARRESVPSAMRALPFLAPHLADRLARGLPPGSRVETGIDAALQRQLEKRAEAWAQDLGPRVSLAVLVVANAGRAVRAYLGSADFDDTLRDGQVDAVTALRSPGSTLKPFIYGLAFDRGLAHPATIVNDAPSQFGDYAPANFMSAYHGEVTLAEALWRSLNVPAVALLDRLGPVAFAERLERAGVRLGFPDPTARPGLALALGGVGISLEDLVRLYAALADDGRARPLRYLAGMPGNEPDAALLRPLARWQVAEILRRLPPPKSQIPDAARRAGRRIAFKTGTSYGFRDAWALGFGGDYTVGVWVGRPDGAPNPGHFGANTAAPLLFQVFELLPKPADPPRPPPGGLGVDDDALPPGLRRLAVDLSAMGGPDSGRLPRIVFPLDRAVLRWRADEAPLRLQAEDGRRPLTWLVDGRPLGTTGYDREVLWTPDGPGFSEIVVVDADGRRAATRVRLVDDTIRFGARLRRD